MEKSSLRAVIFAGGVGTRMWPLSRKKTPKQFERIIGDLSTLQLAVGRLRPETPWENIYVSSGEAYSPLIRKQLPQLPKQNLIAEPKMRDVAPAVGYLMAILAKEDPDGPVAILWSDHLLKKVKTFKTILASGAKYVSDHKGKIVFIGQKPRFANQNLGWIKFGQKESQINGFSLKQFKAWHYRPGQDQAEKYFASRHYAWNTGYFIVNPSFVLSQYQKHLPQMYSKLVELQVSYGTPTHQKKLEKIYPAFKKISFDDAILAKLSPQKAVVLSADLGWSDIGTWEALKEALQTSPNQNLTRGRVVCFNSKNSLVYGFTDQLVTAIDVKGMVVVVTSDAVLVCPQESIPEIKKMLASFVKTKLERYT
ncbi:MAG: Mannose-1-phosphate guanylyltransferase [Candidatus Beckwithbacteria bacterium GW2011_GWB1_47_15]|uniref:Mannose-1-phosphate guanylyltransferase n=1 Tax=Candidatus Beckwithbacteria bacterium GW2011_GWB1_47_15 TaxID=1618371 RepID=A0A0G1RX59_9BACT|nr:MAG: Mannose-1-phosphate guanylyltransferase [Candidatus Beckwithbacteria bacterium GW2011_GWC1_49_16]KKU35627.1 MAG: Mannose-1-phosphate guanylyltransferase [Candidatus Beckwithbacteria bacterium GW2011_GWA1_46_30]KKU61681.1 MAG: Mannose-1-phosphate guanylyltransferase [Candidatus Beckwithbacteria bacterium GW2011_GWB1_47_15]KKU72184.1 MAG: Mannose-1-phosphate guanylyltransferase [Candidatus Beckwithbacteria bacterium GW2011_GWA2_47_25]KKW04809.1 MAG: Mannose-1-phosphate guanylyltransferase